MIPPRILHGPGSTSSGLVKTDRSHADCRYIACASRAAKLPVPRPAGRLVFLFEVGSHTDRMQPNRSVHMRMRHFPSRGVTLAYKRLRELGDNANSALWKCFVILLEVFHPV